MKRVVAILLLVLAPAMMGAHRHLDPSQQVTGPTSATVNSQTNEGSIDPSPPSSDGVGSTTDTTGSRYFHRNPAVETALHPHLTDPVVSRATTLQNVPTMHHILRPSFKAEPQGGPLHLPRSHVGS